MGGEWKYESLLPTALLKSSNFLKKWGKWKEQTQAGGQQFIYIILFSKQPSKLRILILMLQKRKLNVRECQYIHCFLAAKKWRRSSMPV